MARFTRTWMLVGAILALMLACDMPWDEDDKKAPSPPEVTEFGVMHRHGAHSNEVTGFDHPRVEIRYNQNGNPQVVVERSAPHDNHPGFSEAGDAWHGNPVIDEGRNLPDGYLNWGHRYVYRLRGHHAEGGSSGVSQEFTLDMPNFHPPNNVHVVREDGYNVISWSRTTVDDGDGRTHYYVYSRHGDGNYSLVSGGRVNGTTWTDSGGTASCHYRVRAYDDRYGYSAGSAPGEHHGAVPGLPGDGDNGDDGEVVAGEDELVYQGQTMRLTQLWLDWAGPAGSVFIYLASAGINVEDSHSGSGSYVALKTFLADSPNLAGTYSFAAGGSPGTFDGESVVVPVNREVYHYVTGGSFTIEKDGDTYTISGSVQTEADATAAFLYEGTVTGQLGSP